MENLGAREAADRIRSVFFTDRSQRVDPEQAHQMKFVKQVCEELGADHDPETVAHVMTLLREHGVALHAGHEYPKFAMRKWDRTSKIVHSEDEERAWVDEAQPEPVETLNRDAAAAAYTGTAAVEHADHDEFVDDGDEVHVEDIDTLADTEPKSRSGDSSAGKTDTAKRGRRPV